MKKIAVIDYDSGNIFSISQAISEIGAIPIITNYKNDIIDCDAIVLPGVGSFKNAMSNLHNLGLDSLIPQLVNNGTPILGICLGMQLLFDEGYEFGVHKGLGILKGQVIKFEKLDKNYPIPHTQWNKVILKDRTDLFKDLHNPFVYFSHSYYVVPSDQDLIMHTSVYGGISFCCAVESGNICGVQFHPEKSSYDGLKILENFINYI